MAFLTESKLARYTERLWANIIDKIDTNKTSIDKTLTQENYAADAKAVGDAIATHNTSTTAHDDIRDLIEGLTTRLNTLADSDDTTLDQLSEIVSYIKNNKTLIEGITSSKVNVTDIVNNLTSTATNKPLSAAQGKALKDLIDTLDGSLATVATSGSYNDLSNKPTIPAAVTIDTALSTTSTNPVQNKAVKEALDGKANSSHTQSANTISTGTFTGAVTAARSSQTYSTYLLRNSRLATTDTNPSYNGEICWTYE